MAYILGVDGGGSKTFAVIVDERGQRLGWGISGGGNHQGPGIDNALAHIREAVEGALRRAGLVPEQIGFVQYGLAGVDRPKDLAILNPALRTLPFSDWDLVCDTMEGLRAGSPAYTGVVLVCGSGTNAAGRNRSGAIVQTGGFGYLFGDRAGGRDLARETFSCAIRSWECREEASVLTEKVPRYFGHRGMQEMYDDFLDHDVADVPGELTVLLHEAADEGDGLAIRILRKAGRELGLAANSVIRRLGGFDGETIPIVLVGSVVQEGRNPHLLGALEDTVAMEQASYQIRIPDVAPVYGAVLLGMDRLGIPVTEAMMRKFQEYGGYRS